MRGPANAAAVAWMTGGVAFFGVVPTGSALLIAVATSDFSSIVTRVFTVLTVLVGILTAGIGVSIWFMDPGVAPRHMLAAAGNRKLVTTLNAIMPRVIHMKLKQSSMGALGLSQSYAQLRWCDVCLLYKPAGVSHASSISSCVYGFDHFCGVLGRVVGRNNRKRFVWLLLLGGTACVFGAAACLGALWDFWAQGVQAKLPWGEWDTSVPMRVSVYVAAGCLMLIGALRVLGVGGGGPRIVSAAMWLGAQSAAVGVLTAWLPLPMIASPFVLLLPGFVVGACALLSFAGYHLYLIASGSTTKDAMKGAHTGQTLAQRARERAQSSPSEPTTKDMPSSEEPLGMSGSSQRQRGSAGEGHTAPSVAAVTAVAPVCLPAPVPANHVGAAGDEESAPLLPPPPVGLQEAERRAAAAAALGLPTSHALVQDATAAAMASAAAGEIPRQLSAEVMQPTAQAVWRGTCSILASAGHVARFLTTREEHRCIDWTCVVPTRELGEFADAVLEQLQCMTADNMARHMLRSKGSWADLGGGAPSAPGSTTHGDDVQKARRVEELSEQLVAAGVWGLRVNSLFLPPFVMGRVVRASAQAATQGQSCCGAS